MMNYKLSNEEISSLCLELSMLLRAGVNTGDALSLLSEERDWDGLLSGAARKVDEGQPLSEVLRDTGAFPVYVCGLVEVVSGPDGQKRPWPPFPVTMRTGSGWAAGSAAPCCIPP